MSKTRRRSQWDASRLRAVMAAKQVTQNDLATQLGWSPNTVSDYARGRTSPPVWRLEKMARFLKVRVVDLLPESAR